MGTRLAFGPSRARYSIVGQPRPCSEKELILCNMLARRETFLRFGGFNEKLYPNEENALMDQIQKGGGKLYYTPDITIERHPRSTFKAFCKMLMNYGRGRAEQFRLTPTPGSILNFIPPAFCIYLVLLPFLSGLLTWIRHIHIKDAVRTTVTGNWGAEVVWGEGQVNSFAFLNTLKETGYNGAIAIEREAGELRVKDISSAVRRLLAY